MRGVWAGVALPCSLCARCRLLAQADLQWNMVCCILRFRRMSPGELLRFPGVPSSTTTQLLARLFVWRQVNGLWFTTCLRVVAVESNLRQPPRVLRLCWLLPAADIVQTV